jgi:acyl-CoA reductase-like NAD-dependent aldehyde dehydrogenase
MAAVAEKKTRTKKSAPTTPEREQIEVKNPVTGGVIGAIPVNTPEEVREVVERARAAQKTWGALHVKERCRVIRKWGDLMWEDQKNVMRIIREETGKNDAGAFTETFVLDLMISYYYHNAPRFLRPQRRKALFPLLERAKVQYKPYGVVGGITPWNYPLLNALFDVVPALFAGNSIVLKPSEIAPYSAIHAVELMHKAGIPEDVAQIVTGDGRTGAALIDYVDCVTFTGSTAVGRRVAVKAAERLIPCWLELGGKNPVIVLNDVDVDMAATGVLRGVLENAGQVCISPGRIYVEDGVYDKFLARIEHYAKQMTMGTGDGYDVHLGSLTNERELLRVEAHVQDAVEKGAQVVFGGKRRPDLGPLFVEPAILVNVDHSMKVMQEETFGPVIPMMRVANADEAVRLANDIEYGLTAAVFTKDLHKGEQIASRIDSGDVTINRVQVTAATHDAPWGGRKDSGLGRRGGPEGLLRFVSTQAVVTDNLLFQNPELSNVDPLTYKAALAIRKLRRYVPFI